MKTMIHCIRACVLSLAALLSFDAALAQAFPSQTVKIVVPFPPGGTTDILARQLAAELAQKWGTPVIVDNKAGASGTIFSEQLVRMPPDGYTLMLPAQVSLGKNSTGFFDQDLDKWLESRVQKSA
ncbi:MAG: tripartite tricarboxylate transporter substrate-binding protein [Polaromonas sp.]|nr:tripartite tricarboxylate transporter substrate-binding protein [Polaromonas sp.]